MKQVHVFAYLNLMTPDEKRKELLNCELLKIVGRSWFEIRKRGFRGWFYAIALSSSRGYEIRAMMEDSVKPCIQNRFPGSLCAIYCSIAVLPSMINGSSLVHNTVDLSEKPRRAFVEVCPSCPPDKAGVTVNTFKVSVEQSTCL